MSHIWVPQDLFVPHPSRRRVVTMHLKALTATWSRVQARPMLMASPHRLYPLHKEPCLPMTTLHRPIAGSFSSANAQSSSPRKEIVAFC